MKIRVSDREHLNRPRSWIAEGDVALVYRQSLEAQRDFGHQVFVRWSKDKGDPPTVGSMLDELIARQMRLPIGAYVLIAVVRKPYDIEGPPD